MRLKHVQYLLFLAIGAIGCSSNRHTEDAVPFIDVRKTYAEKELNITDLADVSYVHLNADDDDYLYKGRILCVTKNTYVVCDKSSSSILFFSRDGTPKSRFNRLGQGPEEYLGANRILYDEETDDVFLCNYGSNNNYVQVYSSTGEYKRKITFPQNAMLRSLVSFDDKSLLLFAENFHLSPSRRINRKIDIPYTTYYRISKLNGEILDSIKLKSNEVELAVPFNVSGRMAAQYERLTKGVDGFFFVIPKPILYFITQGTNP